MATIVIAMEDMVVKTVKSFITALEKNVAIMEDVSKKIMDKIVNAMLSLKVKIVR